MNLMEAMPEAFGRTWPALDPDSQVLLGLLLLRSRQIDAIPVTLRDTEKIKFISGYSCLKKLAQTPLEDYGRFFKHSCTDYSVDLPIVSADANIGALLKVYSETEFGFVWAKYDANPEIGAFICLRDLLSLYDQSIISTHLRAKDIASRDVFSVEGESKLKHVIEEMINRRRRRVFVSHTSRVVSDRQIIDYLFSVEKLERVFAEPTTLLEGTLGDVESVEPIKIDNEIELKEAAPMVIGEPGLAVCDCGIVTPWDMIMKPWERNELRIAE